LRGGTPYEHRTLTGANRAFAQRRAPDKLSGVALRGECPVRAGHVDDVVEAFRPRNAGQGNGWPDLRIVRRT